MAIRGNRSGRGPDQTGYYPSQGTMPVTTRPLYIPKDRRARRLARPGLSTYADAQADVSYSEELDKELRWQNAKSAIVRDLSALAGNVSQKLSIVREEFIGFIRS